MPTTVIVLGKAEGCKQQKPIEFRFLMVDGHENPHLRKALPTDGPSNYAYVELIARNYCNVDIGGRLDLMFAYNHPDNRTAGVLFLGKFNDGVVE